MAPIKLPPKKKPAKGIVTEMDHGVEIDTATGEPTNSQRARWAHAAVEAHCAVQGSSGDDESDLGDLLTNLAHLLRAEGFDPHERFRQSLDMFDAEEMAPATPADANWGKAPTA